jgi:hypothetical protein
MNKKINNMMATCKLGEVCKAENGNEDICQGKSPYLNGKPCGCYAKKELK